MEPAARAELMKRSEDRDYRGAIDRLSRNARNSRHAGVLEDKRVRVIPTDGSNYILATPESIRRDHRGAVESLDRRHRQSLYP